MIQNPRGFVSFGVGMDERHHASQLPRAACIGLKTSLKTRPTNGRATKKTSKRTYVEPADYFPKSVRKEAGLGEYWKDSKKTGAKKTANKKSAKKK